MKSSFSFNPCFNGFTTLTKMGFELDDSYYISFNPCFNGFTTLTHAYSTIDNSIKNVSILVLMDSLL